MDAGAWADCYESSALAVVEIGTRHATSKVPACPAWTGRDLVAHMAGGPLIWSEVMERDPAAGPPDFGQLRADAVAGLPAESAELAEYTASLIRACAAKFRAIDPNTAVWTFWPPPTAAFWIRRAAMEEAVHLHDAKGIEGVASPIRAEVASDGLDELTEVLIPSWLSYGLPRPTRSLRMSPSGTDRSWLLEGSDGGTEPALVTGDAGSIFMALWRRDVSAVRGDVEVLRAWSQLSEIF